MVNAERKTIAFIAPEPMYPADTGGRIAMFYRLECLIHAGYEVHLFYATKTPKDHSTENLYKDRVASIHVYNRNKTRAYAMARFLCGTPYAVANREFGRMKADLESLQRSAGLSMAIVEFPQMLANLSREFIDKTPIILDQHNIEWKCMLSLADAGINRGVIRYIRKAEAMRLKRYETNIQNVVTPSLITFVSPGDRNDYMFYKGVRKALAVPGATDYSHPFNNVSTGNIVYVSNLTYAANVEGALWLATKVFPEVRRRMPEAQLYLVGKGPSEKIRALASENPCIHVTGRVEDLSVYYRLADAIALPIFSGGGINIKSLEAAMANRPIVATSFAMKGMGLEKSVHYCCAEDVHSFAEGLVKAMINRTDSEQMARRCYEYAKAHYSWDAAGSHWLTEIQDAVNV